MGEAEEARIIQHLSHLVAAEGSQAEAAERSLYYLLANIVAMAERFPTAVEIEKQDVLNERRTICNACVINAWTRNGTVSKLQFIRDSE